MGYSPDYGENIRFFEMLRWVLRSHRLGEFVERYGGQVENPWRRYNAGLLKDSAEAGERSRRKLDLSL